MDYQELIERFRRFEIDNLPYGWLAIRMREISALCDAIESLLAENERLKHNLTTTEQTMREYQELAGKRLEEIAKYRDAPVVWIHSGHLHQALNQPFLCRVLPEQCEGYKQLIVKPGPDNCSGCGAEPLAYITPQHDRTAELEAALRGLLDAVEKGVLPNSGEAQDIARAALCIDMKGAL